MTNLLSELEAVVTDEDVEASGLAYFEQQWDMLPPRSKAIYRHAIRRALTTYASRLPHHAEIAAAVRDAERYRWLRSQTTDGFMGHRYGSLNCDEPESEWDAWIDSAMSQEGEG